MLISKLPSLFKNKNRKSQREAKPLLYILPPLLVKERGIKGVRHRKRH